MSLINNTEIKHENQEGFRLLEWINQMSTKPFDTFGTAQELQQTKEFQADMQSNFKSLSTEEVAEIDNLNNEVSSLKDKLEISQIALDRAKETNNSYRKVIDEMPNYEHDEIDIYKAENNNLSDYISQLNSQNKERVNEYLETVIDADDIKRIRKSFQNTVEQDKLSITKLQEDQQNLINEYSDAYTEYYDLSRDNYSYQKQRLEMINEIESLKTLISNNISQRDDVQKVSDKIARKINNDKLPIHEEIDSVQDKIDYISDQFSMPRVR